MKTMFMVLVFWISQFSAFGQAQFNLIENILRQEAEAWSIPNVAIGITTGEGIVFECEVGADSSSGNYLVGSVSKTFTTLAVMRLVQARRVNLDAPVRTYLPWFETADREASGKITVRHLLNQTGGLPKRAGLFTPSAIVQPDIEAQYRAYLQKLDLVSQPGQRHEYCNLNYQLLEQLIRKVSGQSYETYVEKHLFQPLQMEHSYASYGKAKSHGWKNGYQYWFGFPAKAQFEYGNNALAAGDIASNITDMCRLLQALLRQGKLEDGDSLISVALLKQMQTPLPGRYGMGFSIGPWNDLHSIRHTGLSRNYSCIINLLPEKGYGIVILTNCNSMYAMRYLMDEVMRRLAQK
jgi:CubicO group peptidase (beta-lactamase class C family)